MSQPTGRQGIDERTAYQAKLLAHVHDAILATDDQFVITAWNAAAEKIYGWKADEVLGRPVGDVIRSEFTHAQRSDALKTLAQTGHFNVEVAQYTRHGRRIWMEAHTSVLRDDAGRITGYVEANRDITERKRTEDQLRRSEANLAEAQKLGHTGSWTWHPETGEVFWSLGHFLIFGLDPETFQPTQDNTQRMIHPHDLPGVRQILERAVRDRTEFEVNYRLIRPDGAIRYHHGVGHPVSNEDENLKFVGWVIDVSGRKRAEEQLRRSERYLAEGQRLSHTGSWAWNASTREMFWSREHFRICGVDPETFPLDLETARQAIHPQDRPAANEAFDRAVAQGVDFDHELRIVRPDGTVRHVHSLAHPVFNEAGDVAEYVGTIMDITERREAEEERAQLLRQVVQSQEDERRRIALEMHDQFGQQLSALVMKLSTLRRDVGERKELAQELASLESMARQLDAELELIVLRLRPTVLDDLGLAAAVTNYVNTWSVDFAIRTNVELIGIEPGRLTAGIETTLYRIMQEALNNVAKHARATSVAVLVEARSDRVSLIVEDNGAGFDVDRLGGPDHRFGLTGMRERAALLGGVLEIESVLRQGTTVVARIPMTAILPEDAT